MLEVISYQDWRGMDIDEDDVVITVSKSKNWSRGLSPFILGPCELWGGHVALNMENAWQFSKVYGRHVDMHGDLNNSWLPWAKEGWEDSRAHR